jgi:hypothetical protein
MVSKSAAAKVTKPELTPAEVWAYLSGLPVTDVQFETDESTVQKIVLTLDWKEVEDAAADKVRENKKRADDTPE